MPIYEYQCANCNHTYELIQKMSDAPNALCPKCNKPEAVRLVSAAGFQLKGTGWYVTDFKDKGKPPEKAKNSSEASLANSANKVTETASSCSSSVSSKGENN